MNYVIRQLSLLPFKKEWLPIILLTFIALALWFAGPLIAIADVSPLQQPEKRFYAISLIFLAWFLKIYYFQAKPAKPEVTIKPVYNPELDKKIQTLTEKFQGFISFLNKTLISREGRDVSLATLPWYLVIGSQGSGKTTLLANANVNYVLAKKYKAENIKTLPASSQCDWWVTRDLVLVDIPGGYLNTATVTTPPLGGVLWETFLQLIKRFRGKRALQGIVLTLSLPELLQQKQSTEALSSVVKSIGELRAQFGNHLPFHIMLTKCDVLPGFIEFFSDSGTEELSQAWGITLPEVKDSEQLAEVFSQRFNTLIKRLNKQLISRLHQERNPQTRPHIKDFPLHVERLKEGLMEFLKSVAQAEKHFHLQGVYLTSAIQQQNEDHLVQVYSASATGPNKNLPVIHNVSLPGRPYFIRQILMQGLANRIATAGAPQKIWKWQHRPGVYAFFASLTLMASFFIVSDFRHNLQLTAAVKMGLLEYQTAVKLNDTDINKALPLLDALEARTKALKHTVLFHTAKTRRHARQAYQDALQSIIFTGMKSNFENYLQASDYSNPEAAYLVLKAYLELGDKKHFQPDAVLSILKKAGLPMLAAADDDKVLHHVNAAFALEFKPLSLNQDVIASARARLASVAAVDLSFIILRNMDNNNEAVTLTFPDLIKNSSTHPVLITKMFSGEKFAAIYARDVETAALEVVQGNWVLGDKVMSTVQQNFAPLVEQLRTFYLVTYVRTWENLLSNLQTAPANTLTAIDEQAQALTSSAAPLAQAINVIRENTNFAPLTSVSLKLAAINNLQPKTLTAVNAALKQLHTDLQKIAAAHNPANAALQASADRMQDTRNQSADPITQLHALARNNPEPLKHILDTLATETWHTMLQDAGNYAEDHWQTDVMTSYRADFENRYPLYATATAETPLAQFVKFMQPEGTLTNYLKNYLESFIEIKQGKAVWKTLDNEHLPFTDAALMQIVQLLELQPVFFPDKTDQFSVRFTLQPRDVSKNTQNVTLKINGQTIQYDRSDEPVPLTFIWDTEKSGQTTLSFTSRDNQKSNAVYSGDWGWFRLVNQSINRVIKPNELLLNLTNNDYAVSYFLFTHGAVNPFMSLQQLRLPEQLNAPV
jgi:type VI secretion system protein ImpL